ncbi:hypothetical protein DH2020_025813 [Rehmannia glutinosa]|uniref:Uncharacterized protein n=1 Tax=Rehmannia glutinosa TaxID=99300 RepID=A0ABR0W270_REHGL
MAMAMSKILLSLSPTPPSTIPKPHPHPNFPFFFQLRSTDDDIVVLRRSFILTAFTTFSSLVTLSTAALAETPTPPSPSPSSNPSRSFLSGIANTKSWFQFYGDGFAIRVPPNFEDIMEPEDCVGLKIFGIVSNILFEALSGGLSNRYVVLDSDLQVALRSSTQSQTPRRHCIRKVLNMLCPIDQLNAAPASDYNAGLSLYGDKAKPKTYAARFATPDGSEVLSVVVRPSNQLKITFLEAKDIADLGSLKEAAKIFVPVGATLYSARAIKIKEEEGYRNYYFYEFGNDEQHVALVAAVNSGKAIIAGATAPQKKWVDDGVRLRSAAVSLTLV